MNEDMRRIAGRLRAWRSHHGATADTPEARHSLEELLRADEVALRTALVTVRTMGWQEMLDLQAQHHELNTPDGVDVDYATQLVDAFCGPDSDHLLVDVDDYVNMLKRVVEYAQYA